MHGQIGEFILKTLWDEEKQQLFRFHMDKQSSVPAYAEDYAHIIEGFLDLYTCCADLKWLQWAMRLQERMDDLFWDPVYGGYFMTTEDNQSLPFRIKFCFDTDEPSASSVALSNLFRFCGLLHENDFYTRRATETMEAFAMYFDEFAMLLPEFASSACLAAVHPALCRVVIVGDKKSDKTQQLLDAMHSIYAPSKSLIFINPNDKDNMEFWSTHQPVLMEELSDVVKPKIFAPKSKKALTMKQTPETGGEASPVAFVCQNTECSKPLDTPQMLVDYMRQTIEEDFDSRVLVEFDTYNAEMDEGEVIDLEESTATESS